MTSTKLAVAGFVIPYIFVLSPNLLIRVDNFHPLDTTIIAVTAVIGVVSLAGAVQGFLYLPTKFYERAILFLAAILLISADYIHSVVGIGAFGRCLGPAVPAISDASQADGARLARADAEGGGGGHGGGITTGTQEKEGSRCERERFLCVWRSWFAWHSACRRATPKPARDC